MIVLGLFLALSILGVILLVYNDKCYDWKSAIGQFNIGAGIILTLLFSALGIPVTRQNDYETMASYHVMKAMLSEARTSNSVEKLERAAIMNKVFDINEKIEYAQRWNNSQWDWWHPDEVMQLEPLK